MLGQISIYDPNVYNAVRDFGCSNIRCVHTGPESAIMKAVYPVLLWDSLAVLLNMVLLQIVTSSDNLGFPGELQRGVFTRSVVH